MIGDQRYRCSGNCRWSLRSGGVLLSHLASGNTTTLDYPEAAVWELLTRYPPLQVTPKVAAIAGISTDDAEQLVGQCIQRWVAEGYLLAA